MLVLALLVMMVLIVVVTQLRYSTEVDLGRAENVALQLQMEKLAEAAMRKAQVVLIMDLDEEQGGGEAGGDPTGGGGLAGGPAGGMDPGMGADLGTGTVADSLDEAWAQGDIPFDLGQESELEVRIYVEDEDRKLNLLVLGARDEEYREEWRERAVRALDLLREGKERDLSSTDADRILLGFEEFMRGERKLTQLEDPPLATGPFVDDRGRELFPPLSLGELTLAGGVDESLLYGFEMVLGQDDREWVPGLSSAFTVWSNLEFDDGGIGDPERDPDEPAPPTTDGDAEEDEEESEDPDEPETPAPGVNNGRINVNTAPISVLRSLIPEDELPSYAWEEYDEFRTDYLERLAEAEDDPFAIDDPFEEIDADEPVYPLETVEDLRRFESFATDNFALSEETWLKLQSVLTVQSHVFSITVVVATQTEPHHYYVARSVVWRRSGSEGAEMLPVMPFERLPVTAVDLREFSEELSEYDDW